jgi:hypothetical protein
MIPCSSLLVCGFGEGTGILPWSRGGFENGQQLAGSARERKARRYPAISVAPRLVSVQEQRKKHEGVPRRQSFIWTYFRVAPTDVGGFRTRLAPGGGQTLSEWRRKALDEVVALAAPQSLKSWTPVGWLFGSGAFAIGRPAVSTWRRRVTAVSRAW